MTPADLTNPFGPSCCDGGECSDAILSAQPCGCDPGAGWLCSQHKFKQTALALISRWRDEAGPKWGGQEPEGYGAGYDAALSAAADELEAIL